LKYTFRWQFSWHSLLWNIRKGGYASKFTNVVEFWKVFDLVRDSEMFVENKAKQWVLSYTAREVVNVGILLLQSDKEKFSIERVQG